MENLKLIIVNRLRQGTTKEQVSRGNTLKALLEWKSEGSG